MASTPPVAQTADEAARLEALNVDVQNQGDLERDLAQQADKLLAEKVEENETKRLEKATREKDRVTSQIREIERRLRQPMSAVAQQRLELEVERLISTRDRLGEDVRDIQKRIADQRRVQQTAPSSHGGSSGRQPNESRRDYLLRTGKITPFDIIADEVANGPASALQDALIGAEDEEREKEEREQDRHNASHRNLTRPGLDFENLSESSGHGEPSRKRPKLDKSASTNPTPTPAQQTARETSTSNSPHSSASYVASEKDGGSSEDDDYMPETKPDKKSAVKRKRGKSNKADQEDGLEDLSGVDDGNESVYRDRLQLWTDARSAARLSNKEDYEDDPNQPEWCKPHPKYPDLELPNGLKVPGDISHHLFPYQKTGVQWLWELHQQSVGGIVGDEMGLGKTIQAITYLAALHHSGMYSKPAIVVCPATLMVQWVTEFHNWWPALRVSMLHSSGSGMLNVNKERDRETRIAEEVRGASNTRYLTAGQKAAKKILKRVFEEGHVLVTTYSGLQSYADDLIGVEWGCAILDEGHKIRNPDAAITLSCKELQTPHRIILSGTPMQNSLIDLWSLFDFVFPMRLGTLVTFKNQFEIPIRQGGYASASNLQVQTATRCAETLRDAIKPYFLQRFKTDVASDLPKKTEQVIFCKLTAYQRDLYRRYLASDEMESIIKGKKKSFAGITFLRKVCNHPDLTERPDAHGGDHGNPDRSGKMKVLQSLLELWRDTGHKTLLFAQGVQTLNILEKFLLTLGKFTYLRMDGTTSIPKRQGMVTKFNDDPEINVFLLTTKVGGIGINLTGADRVILYDPDWNPSVDGQASERSWRLGQKRDVTIFRLMTKGTIEEKMYHRQIFKQLMTNKITKDPQQREGLLNINDLYDLFTLTDEDDHDLETTKVFKNAEVSYQEEKPEPKTTNFSLRRGRRDAEVRFNAGSKPPPLSDHKVTTPPAAESDELSKVPGIANVEEFTSGDKDKSGTNTPTPQGAEADDSANTEDRLMKHLFANSNVHAALEHSQIINGKSVAKSEAQMIDTEARRVANQAAAGLRRAEAVARSAPVGIPTWTGHFGVAGRPSGSGQGARGSSAILGNLTPSGTATGTPDSRETSSDGTTRMPRGREFIPLIKRFLRSRRGPVPSHAIISAFQHYCINDQRSSEFTAMMREVAELTRDRQGRGLWVLKPEHATARPRAAGPRV